jgi:hypothetical protein
MQLKSTLVLIAAACLANSAQAATKFYDASRQNGIPGDFLNTATNLCPPIQTTVGLFNGFTVLTDDDTGTVTLDDIDIKITTFIDLGPDQLVVTFGPGAFIFIDAAQTQSFPGGHASTTSGIGAHGPSGTTPGQSAEWGIVSGWTDTGRIFCLSSPVTICNNAEFAHGATIPPKSPSITYDLGTWNFDAVGNYQVDTPYVQRTSNGGLANSRYDLRGAFQGASLPVLPALGFAALAAGLAVIGSRSLLGKR